MLGALFGFRGRLSRPGFWEVVMSIVLIDVALIIGRMYLADSGLPGALAPSSQLSQALMGAVPWVLVVFTLWGLLAASVKRCHDRGRTGFLVLVGLIPLIGWLWLLIDLFVLEGTEGRNRYGKVPHGPDSPGRGRFEWASEPAAAEPAAAEPAPAPAAGHMMLDPEPSFDHHAAPPEAAEPRAPEPVAETHEVQAEAAAAPALEEPPSVDEADHAAIDHDPHPQSAPATVHEPEHEPAHAEPAPEPVRRHEEAPAPEPYDPLTAPLVLNVR